MIPRSTDRAGVTLVELLVVLGIVATIAVVAVPLIGTFRTDPAELATRELFNILRAAQTYATTYNVDTAVAYAGDLVGDGRDSFSRLVPIVNAVAVVRRLTREEFIVLDRGNQQLLTSLPEISRDGERPFVVIASGTDMFQFLPDDSCVLPNLFEYDLGPPTRSLTGLTAIRIWDDEERVLIEPRFEFSMYDANDDRPREFPAHQFSSDGGLIFDFEGPQRYSFSVGVFPNAEPENRFFLESEQLDPDPETTDIFFNQHYDYDPALPLQTVADDLDLDPFEPVDRDSELTLYVPTGRVKVESDS